MNKDVNASFNEMTAMNDQLLGASLESYKASSGKKKQKSSGCPFTIETVNDPLTTRFDFHYSIGVILHPYDYVFDAMIYTNQAKASKKILAMPRHLRNTLFMRHEKIKEIRGLDFSTIFIIAEEMKDKTNALYNKELFSDALNQYNTIYSLFKWVELTNKEKEEKLFKTAYDPSSDPIVDSDITVKQCRVNHKEQYDDETFRSGMTFLLKAMSYCYIHLQVHSEAIKCLDEALEYGDDSKPDVFFRRAQARMYNKYSTREELELASEDFKKAVQRRKGEKVIDDHYLILKELIKTKDEMESGILKKLISNFSYAHSKIKEKKLDITQTYQKNYDMTHLNYKIMKEMEEAYYYTLRHHKKTNNLLEYNKGVKEFEAFLDDFIHYKHYYNLSITKIPKRHYDLLSQQEKATLGLIASSQEFTDLFNDFKFKKCDEIYMNMHFNQCLWDKCLALANEKEKMNSDPPSQPSHPLIISLKHLVALFQIKSSKQFYFGSLIFFVFSFLLIAPQVYTYTK